MTSDLLNGLLFVVGAVVVLTTLLSATYTFVVPRARPVFISRTVFIAVRRAFVLRMHWTREYHDRDRIMTLYGPLSLVALLAAWLLLVFAGFLAMYWGLGARPWQHAFVLSGSSMFTLGFAVGKTFAQTALCFVEAAIGLGIVALLIAYLPTMYAAFQRRESAVALLEARAGSPPAAEKMLIRYHLIRGLDKIGEVWRTWELWFADVEESHTSIGPVAFFRSPKPDRSWVTAAGAVLDTAALVSSTLDLPRQPEAELCIRAGYVCLRSIADFYSIPYDPDPSPDDPTSVTRLEFDEVYDNLAAKGLPLRPDRAQAWRDFNGWRVNYDAVLIALAGLTMAPYAKWSADRAVPFRPTLRSPWGIRRSWVDAPVRGDDPLR